jgi:hypothetical protein
MRLVIVSIIFLLIMTIAHYYVSVQRIDFLYTWNFVKKDRVDQLEERIKALEDARR